MSSRTIRTGLLLALIVGYVLHAAQYSFLIDDAYISFRYARNLVDGHGLVFNVGEAVEGYSNLTWVLAMAAGMVFGITPESLSTVLGFAAGIATLVFTWRLSNRWQSCMGGTPWVPLVPIALLIANRSFVAWTTGGLETRVFSLLIVAALLLVDVELERGRRAFPTSAFVLAALTLTRVDGFIPAFTIVAGVWVHRGLKPGQHGWWMGAAVVAAAAVQTAFRISYYGDVLPNTFRVKVGGLALEPGLEYLGRAFADYGLPLTLLAAAVTAWRLRHDKPVAWIALALVTTHFLYVAAIGGDHFEFRMLDSIWAPLAVLAGSAFTRSGVRVRDFGSLLLVVVLAIWNAKPAITGFEDVPPFEIVSVETEALYCTQWAAVGKWFAENADPDEVIAVKPAGVIPYLSGLRALDMHGLNDRIIAVRPADPTTRVAGHRKLATAEDVLLRAEADYILAHPTIFLEPAPPPLPPPRIKEVANRRFALVPVARRIEDFWLVFQVVSEEAVTGNSIDTSRIQTRIRPSR